MKRRNFLGISLASVFAFASRTAIAGNAKRNRQKAFRIVQFTDMHIYPSEKVEKAINALINEVNALEDQPDFILNTGDSIMDALKKSKEDVTAQWEAWQNYFYNKLKYKVFSCIGNHDVWGWGLSGQVVKNDPLYGKTWAMKELKLSNRYYSFEHKNWKFIGLDSSHFSNNRRAYTAKLDEEQFSWLESELANTHSKTSVCIFSHIPILSSSVFFDGNNEKDGDWRVPGAWMHIDARKIKDLFHKYPNVKVALSGHIHLADRTEYLGVNYYCNGAVCGAWWNGNSQEFAPAYAIMDFYNNGSAEARLVPYKF